MLRKRSSSWIPWAMLALLAAFAHRAHAAPDPEPGKKLDGLNRACYRMSAVYEGSETRSPVKCNRKHAEARWYVLEKKTLATRTTTTAEAFAATQGCLVTSVGCDCWGGLDPATSRDVFEDDDNARMCRCRGEGVRERSSDACAVTVRCTVVGCSLNP